MNKLVFVLLAVCLITVQSAYVKRDAPAAPPTTENYLENIKNQVQALTNDLNTKVQAALNPEKVKKELNDLIDNLHETASKLGVGVGAKA